MEDQKSSAPATHHDYVIEDDEPLGLGAMGAVWRGRQISVPRQVAIKKLYPPPDPAKRALFFTRFRREVTVLGVLSHPNIVAIYGSGTVDDTPYIAMELVDGSTIEQEIEERKAERRTFTPREIVDIAIGGARALAAAHEKGIVHRDLKPSNLMLDKAGRLVVTDFGIAKILTGDDPENAAKLTGTGDVIGTPVYMAPEQIAPPEGQEADYRVDFYGLGAILYELTTLSPPVAGRNPYEVMHRCLHEERPPVRELSPDAPEELASIIEWLMSKDREKRPQSYVDLLNRLEAFKKALDSGVSSAPALRRSRRKALLVAVVSMALLTPAVVAVIAGDRNPRSAGGTEVADRKATPEAARTDKTAEQEKRGDRENGKDAKVEERKIDGARDAAPAPQPDRTSLLAELAARAPSDDERTLVREVMARLASHAAELRARSYAPPRAAVAALLDDPRATGHARRSVQAALEILDLAARAVEARRRTIAESSSPITVALTDGTRATGIASEIADDAFTLTMQPESKRVRVSFAQLAVEDLIVGEAAAGRAAYALRALSGDAHRVLATCVELLSTTEDVVFWLPGLVALAREEGAALAKAATFDEARRVFEAVMQHETVVTKYYAFLADGLAQIRSEADALALLAKDDFEAILTAHPGTHAHPVAARRLCDRFTKAATEDLLDAERALFEWTLRPPEADIPSTIRHWDIRHEDGGTDSIMLRDLKALRSLVRKDETPEASKGFILTWRFDGEGAQGRCMRLPLQGQTKGDVYLKIDGATVSLHRVPQDDKSGETVVLASAPMPKPDPSSKWRTVAVVAGRDHLFFFADGAYHFPVALSDASVPKYPSVGVFGGEIRLRTLHVIPR